MGSLLRFLYNRHKGARAKEDAEELEDVRGDGGGPRDDELAGGGRRGRGGGWQASFLRPGRSGGIHPRGSGVPLPWGGMGLPGNPKNRGRKIQQKNLLRWGKEFSLRRPKDCCLDGVADPSPPRLLD